VIHTEAQDVMTAGTGLNDTRAGYARAAGVRPLVGGSAVAQGVLDRQRATLGLAQAAPTC
jgi:hypothetical protein